MKECDKCYYPATQNGLCTYCGGKPLRTILRERKITRSQFREMLNVCDRTLDRVHSGERQLNELEMRGLLTIDNRGTEND